jgi:hypothetical protein
MSDEQTEILRQMLDMQKQTLAFAKSQRDEFLALQNKALKRQRNSLLFGLVMVLIGLGVLVLSLSGPANGP